MQLSNNKINPNITWGIEKMSFLDSEGMQLHLISRNIDTLEYEFLKSEEVNFLKNSINHK